MHASVWAQFSIVASYLQSTPLAPHVSYARRYLGVHYGSRVTDATCTSRIQKGGISATVLSGGTITFVDYCISLLFSVRSLRNLGPGELFRELVRELLVRELND